MMSFRDDDQETDSQVDRGPLGTPVPPDGAAAADFGDSPQSPAAAAAAAAHHHHHHDHHDPQQPCGQYTLESALIDDAADKDPFPEPLQGDCWLCKNCGTEHSGGFTLTCKCGHRVFAGLNQLYVPPNNEGRRKPWVNGAEATKCARCSCDFVAGYTSSGVHHCRQCGGAVCDGCSETNRWPCDGYGMALQRVCNRCYVRLLRTFLGVRIEIDKGYPMHRTFVTLMYFYIRVFLNDGTRVQVIVDVSQSRQQASVAVLSAPSGDRCEEPDRVVTSTEPFEQMDKNFRDRMLAEMRLRDMPDTPRELTRCGPRERLCVRVVWSALADDKLKADEMALFAAMLTAGLNVEFNAIMKQPERVQVGRCPQCQMVLWWPMGTEQLKRCTGCAKDRPAAGGWWAQQGWTPLPGPILGIQSKESNGKWKFIGYSESLTCAHLTRMRKSIWEKAEALRDSPAPQCVVSVPQEPQISQHEHEEEVARWRNLLRTAQEAMAAAQEQSQQAELDSQLRKERDDLALEYANLRQETQLLQEKMHEVQCHMGRVHEEEKSVLQNKIDDMEQQLQTYMRMQRQQRPPPPQPGQSAQPPPQPGQPAQPLSQPAQPAQPLSQPAQPLPQPGQWAQPPPQPAQPAQPAQPGQQQSPRQPSSMQRLQPAQHQPVSRPVQRLEPQHQPQPDATGFHAIALEDPSEPQPSVQPPAQPPAVAAAPGGTPAQTHAAGAGGYPSIPAGPAAFGATEPLPSVPGH
eukprot:TRINITY_DN915_c0_g1_i2.p1 TRINITY_DN915_c0_g1~~TRINITY_DN915_c0_g1_i2.p1  ORF type:complete len:741 (+),score=160.05 TRINITY_DN915_c0_g1_i2:61-2283(+)